MEAFGAGGVRTGAAYEADREATRARLAASAEQRRVQLGDDLVLVFETADTVRSALEELLRAERASAAERVEAEAAAFAALPGGSSGLAAVLFVDLADPAALVDRLAELSGVAEHVVLEIDGARVPARAGPGDDGSGAFHLHFALDATQRSALLDGGPLTAAVDHPACRVRTALSAEQTRAVITDLRR